MTGKWIVDRRTLNVGLCGQARGRCRPSSFVQIDQRATDRRAFTLIEILVVLGIITLIAALGVPVYNALSGSRSVEAAQNQVSAYLGQARTIAINEGKSAGVMFYVDPATERTAMAIVIVGDTTLEDPDPYEKYKGWIPGAEYTTGDLDPNNDGNTSDRTRADRVIGMVSDANSAFDAASYPTGTEPNFATYTEGRRYIGNYRPAVRTWRAEETHTSGNTAGNRPPRTGPGGSGSPRKIVTIPTYAAGFGPAIEATDGYSTVRWGLAETARTISQYAQSEQQLLPKGIGLQVIIQPTARVGGGYQDRYLQTAVILFDAQGRLSLRELQLPDTTVLGEYLDLSQNADTILSGVGVALYNDAAFGGIALTNPSAKNVDWLYSGNDRYRIVSGTNPALDASQANAVDEKTKEDWLSNNTVPILINRFSGSLSTTE